MLSLAASAQQFDEYFVDRTLRLDYIFAGNNELWPVAILDCHPLLLIQFLQIILIHGCAKILLFHHFIKQHKSY